MIVVGGKPGDSRRWVENPEAIGLRLEERSHDGWYVDEYGHEAAHGVVYRLPHGRFLYGVADPYNDGPAYLRIDVVDDKADARCWANEEARRYAEREREHQEAFRAECRLEEIPDEIANIRAGLLSMLRNRASLNEAGVTLLRRTVQRGRREMKKLREEMDEARDLLDLHRGIV